MSVISERMQKISHSFAVGTLYSYWKHELYIPILASKQLIAFIFLSIFHQTTVSKINLGRLPQNTTKILECFYTRGNTIIPINYRLSPRVLM